MTTIYIVQNIVEHACASNIRAFFDLDEATHFMNGLEDRIDELRLLIAEDPDTDYEEYEDVMGIDLANPIDRLYITHMEVY